MVELHEQPWFPAGLRNSVTDVLQFLLNRTRYQNLVAPLLKMALNRSQATQVVDLCSGAGGPWPDLVRTLGQDAHLSVCLTDKFPNEDRFESIERASVGRITYARSSVDAECVPPKLSGFRTIFNSLHHFSPERVRAILLDAVEKGEGIAAFEVPRRSIAAACLSVFMGLGTLLAVPFVRPFQLSLFVWTYLIPIVPLVMWVDGLASCLRAYTPSELRDLCSFGAAQHYRWMTGTLRKAGTPIAITYLVGYPVRRA